VANPSCTYKLGAEPLDKGRGFSKEKILNLRCILERFDKEEWKGVYI